jgi:hypothetical protein
MLRCAYRDEQATHGRLCNDKKVVMCYREMVQKWKLHLRQTLDTVKHQVIHTHIYIYLNYSFE